MLAKSLGLGSVPHAGEVAGAASVRGALETLGADRLRHGIRAEEDPGLVRELAGRGTVLDVCPLSNLRTGRSRRSQSTRYHGSSQQASAARSRPTIRRCSTPTSRGTTRRPPHSGWRPVPSTRPGWPGRSATRPPGHGSGRLEKRSPGDPAVKVRRSNGDRERSGARRLAARGERGRPRPRGPARHLPQHADHPRRRGARPHPLQAGEDPRLLLHRARERGCCVGVATAMGPEDVGTPLHRDMGVHITRGVEPWKIFAQFMGRADGPTHGRDGNVHMADEALGLIAMVSHLPAMLPVATGCALAFRIREEARVAVGWFGEGASARGDVHEYDDARRARGSSRSSSSATTTSGRTRRRRTSSTRPSTWPTARRRTASKASSSTAPTCSRSTARRSARSRRRAPAAARRCSSARPCAWRATRSTTTRSTSRR